MRPQDLIAELEEDENGRFTLEEENDRAILRVYPPGRSGRPVKPADVFARLDLFALEGYHRYEIEDIVTEADGEPNDICAWKAPDAVDAVIHVELAADEMSAVMEIVPPKFKGNWPGESELFAALRAAGVTRGLREDEIRKMAAREWEDLGLLPDGRPAPGGDAEQTSPPASHAHEEKKAGEVLVPGSSPARTVRMVAAEGKDPREGSHGYIRHFFAANPRAAPRVEPDHPTRVDFRDLSVIQTCEQDALLAELVTPEQGTPGFTVTGRALEPQAVEEARLFAGDNTRFSDDQTALYAAIPGQVTISGDGPETRARIDVREILNVEEVNFSTGNVDFPGTVVVDGTVLDGFEVKARGDIIIQRSVSNVKLMAEGDVILAGGVVGRGASYIQAGGDLFARFAQNSTLYASRGIFIEEASMSSRLTAGANIAVEGGRGEIIGGSTLCAGLVRVRKLGSRGEVYTPVTVGLKPETMASLRALEEEYEDTRKTLTRVQTSLAQFAENERLGKALTAEEETNLNKLKMLEERYLGLLENLDHQRDRLYGSIKPDRAAQVVSVEAVFPGSEVSFGTGVKRYKVENRAHYGFSRFVLAGDAIQMRGNE